MNRVYVIILTVCAFLIVGQFITTNNAYAQNASSPVFSTYSGKDYTWKDLRDLEMSIKNNLETYGKENFLKYGIDYDLSTKEGKKAYLISLLVREKEIKAYDMMLDGQISTIEFKNYQNKLANYIDKLSPQKENVTVVQTDDRRSDYISTGIMENKSDTSIVKVAVNGEIIFTNLDYKYSNARKINGLTLEKIHPDQIRRIVLSNGTVFFTNCF